MPTFTSENRQAWQNLFNDVDPQRPSVGKRVRVTQGKHIDKVGIVFWHRPDPFASTRYATDAQLALREAIGRRGWRVGVKTEQGKKFFCSADYVEVIIPESKP